LIVFHFVLQHPIHHTRNGMRRCDCRLPIIHYIIPNTQSELFTDCAAWRMAQLAQTTL
jgi:hypothetical protein